MAYTPTEWECGDTVTAEKLNAMERGIADMNGEYVPNVWACGDTITAEKLNHMEQGIAAGGGGGSSDFSTATVTVVITGNGDLEIPVVEDAPMNCINIHYPIDEGVYTCPLYKGALNVRTFPSFEGAEYSIAVTGNAEVFDTEIYITGDCTITIS